MKKISRRNFLSDSALLTSSALLLPSWLMSSTGESRLKNPSSTKAYPSYLDLEEKGLLSERVEKLDAYYESCHLCPRDCHVNRMEGQTGKCQASSKVKVSSAQAHFGEERPLVGSRGSGTIFFSNCGLRCVFCQNYKISIEGEGVEISDRRLAETMIKVQNIGCHNINVVTPTHYVSHILLALDIAAEKGLRLPLVYNTCGWERLDILKMLDGIVDIYLPDMKFMDADKAAQYSGEASDYPEVTQKAIIEMHRQVGEHLVNSQGITVRGLMIRHLVMPNRVAGTKKFVRWVAENLPKSTYVNIMHQYHPDYLAFDYPEIWRRINVQEYLEAMNWADEYGLTNLDPRSVSVRKFYAQQATEEHQ